MSSTMSAMCVAISSVVYLQPGAEHRRGMADDILGLIRSYLGGRSPALCMSLPEAFQGGMLAFRTFLVEGEDDQPVDGLTSSQILHLWPVSSERE